MLADSFAKLDLIESTIWYVLGWETTLGSTGMRASRASKGAPTEYITSSGIAIPTCVACLDRVVRK
jgi:hypothetical protein